ncbi:MAG: MFS transporter [Candidatus Thermoplasmatota archaeon]
MNQTKKKPMKLILWLLLASSTLTVMAGSIIGPVVRDIGLGLGVGASAAGLIITMHGVFVFMLSPAAGSLVDKIGSKTPYVIGLILYGIAGGAGVFINSYYLLLFSRALLGVAVALIFTSVTVIILNLYHGKEKDKAMGFRGSANSMGAAIWPLIGGFLGTISWHLTFSVYLVAIPLGVLSLRYMPEVHRERVEANKETVFSVFKKKPVLIAIYVLMLLTNILLYVNVVYLPQILDDIGIQTTFQVGLLLSLMGLSAAVTASRYDKIKKRLYYQKIIPATMLLWTTGFSLIFFFNSLWSTVLSVVLFGVGLGMMLPTVMLWIGDVVSSSFLGRFSSYLSTFGFLGQFLSPILFAPIFELFGLQEIFLAASITTLFGLFLSLLNLYLKKSDGRTFIYLD